MGYTWSFADVVCSLSGPGGTVMLGYGAGNAEEGITTSNTEEKDTITTGADGEIMHSLNASQTGRIIVRLLRTSPINAQLSNLYNTQRGSSANWGQNAISVGNTVIGDSTVGTEMAFVKHPDVVYAKMGGVLEWEFGGIVTQSLGAGLVGLALAV